MNRLDPDADVFLKSFIQNFKGKNYIKSAYQKLAWQALIQGNTEKYRAYMKILLKLGVMDIDEDAQAQKEAEENQVPNVFLLQARLLSDGGYYQRAVASIAAGTKTYISIKDQLEVTYRMGRISQEEGNYSKAESFYTSTLQLGKQYTYYFAANAALQLGLIWEQKKELKKARFYYQTCLNMKNHDYQHSIDQKAKAGLNRLDR
jgi:tetratricopeptide (TPR) repeat protein